MNLPDALRRLTTLAAALLLCSCATRTPHAVIMAPLTAQVCWGDEFHANVTSPTGQMSQAACQTLGVQIDRDVQALAQPPTGAPRRYHAEVNITRYSEGNFFASSVLPGAGEIHVEGTVTLYQMPRRMPVGTFAISKHFIPVGLFAAFVKEYTISDAFAKGVAKTLCNVR
ncbi:hypothetical protein [Prosthecobacter sp.]|uniref:hypothetical protein n=1 Tax=Prosthecobacter sp. TaxID=1965333 RepID=UPI0037850501